MGFLGKHFVGEYFNLHPMSAAQTLQWTILHGTKCDRSKAKCCSASRTGGLFWGSWLTADILMCYWDLHFHTVRWKNSNTVESIIQDMSTDMSREHLEAYL